MAHDLKVLMMGGQRVGKSSALAAIMNSFVNGAVRNIITAKDTTSLAKINGEKQASIESKLEEIQTTLRKNVKKTILVDSGKTNIKWDYNLRLTIPENGKSMNITFTDVNGEFFEGHNKHMEDMMNMMKDYDVFIVSIDTPFMMESRKKGLVTSLINQKYNCIDPIHTFLTLINDSDGNDAKMVIFTPIKCEKWAKEGKLDDVVRCVKEDYAITIQALCAFKKIQVEILPIQTAGSIVFKEHKEPFLFRWEESFFFFFSKERTSKCSVVNASTVRLADGSTKRTYEGKKIDDPESVLYPGSKIIKPNSWFEVTSQYYVPYNCEQVAFHILDFMCSKVVDAKIRSNEGGFLANLLNKMFESLSGIFGGISLNEMKAVVEKMYASQLIKKGGEGIQILNECNFRSK